MTRHDTMIAIIIVC